MISPDADRVALTEGLRAALDTALGLPARDIESINVLIDAGELQVALETLCTQIYEYDVEVTSARRSALEDLGVSLGVPVAYLLGDPWADPPNQREPG